jgi:hypothetical protein
MVTYRLRTRLPLPTLTSIDPFPVAVQLHSLTFDPVARVYKGGGGPTSSAYTYTHYVSSKMYVSSTKFA